MSDYNEGDLVEASKGRTQISGVLTRDAIRSDLRVEETGWGIDSLKGAGFTVTVIERAKPALPTEPGWYLDRHGVLWDLKEFWNCKSLGTTIRPTSRLADEFGPFTRLEPVAETAKKVLETVRQRAGVVRASHVYEQVVYEIREGAVSRIAAEFGVTGELGE